MKVKKHKSGGAWERKLLALAVASCFAAELSYANPVNPTVVHGKATFATNGNTLTVTNTPGAVINWQSFGIASQDITRFLQQSGASAVLNRVTGATPSTILGQLQSNGRVYLINPNGITIGKGAVIDVAGFVASSLNLSDADFLAGRQKFTETPGASSVANHGTIQTSRGGMVYLVGQNVENHGIIRTPKGEIVLAAGKTIELVDAGTPEIRVQITAPNNEALNLGKLFASGGHIGMYAGLVRHGGTANANTAVVGENGKIVFKAVKDVKLDAGSVTTASGSRAGSITVEAQTGTAVVAGKVEANSTAAAGGTIDISGQQGVTVEPTGRVTANGVDGGSIALKSSAGPVQVSGQVSANAAGGRGGQVAITAATQASLAAGAQVSASGPKGGGSVSVSAVESVNLESGSTVEASGTTGGIVTVAAEQGPVEVNGTIEAKGSTSTGGAIKVAALGDITLGDSSVLNVRGRAGGDTWIESREGTTLASGLIDAYGRDGPGGKVLLLGPRVGLVRNATINASGETGGGVVLVGGDFQGKNPDIQNAERTYVGLDVRISADAIETGDGGKVIVWADGDTRFYGRISARGGANDGNGGFVEVSGKQYLDYRGLVDARAPKGAMGTLLLDPAEITISDGNAGDTTGITCAGGGDCTVPGGVGPFLDTAAVPAAGGILTDGTINAQLQLANVTVQTTATSGGDGNIVITGGVAIAPTVISNPNTLTLDAATGISWTGNWSYTNDGQLTLHAANGTISGGANTLTLGGPSPLLMQATAGIGTSGTPVLTAGVTDLAAKTATGGIFTSNSAIGNINITSLTNPVTSLSVVGLSTTTSGDISLKNAAGSITASQDVTVGGATDVISIIADSIIFAGGQFVADGMTGKVIVAPSTALTLITVGDAAVDDIDFGGIAFLTTGNIVAGTLQVGDSNNTGGISIAGAFNPGFTTLHLKTGADIDATASGNTVTATNLALSAGTGIGATFAISTDVTNIAATNTVSGNIRITDASALTVDTVDGVAGITTVADGNIALTASTDLTISEVVTAGGAGTIDLTATTGALAIDAAVSSTSGAITLTAGGAISQDATNGSLATSGLLSTSSDGGTVLNGANAVGAFTATNTGTGNIELTNTIATLDIQGITQNTGDVIVDNTGAITQSVAGITTVADGNIALTASTDLTISEVVTAGGAGTIDLTATTGALAIDAAVSSTSGAITLTAGGAISQDATNGSLATSGLLSTSSDGGTVLNGANAVGAFTATNTGTGNIELTNTIATLDIQGITQNTGDVIVDNTGAITQSVAGITTVADGNIALTASTDLTISEVVTAGGAGTIDLTATTGALAIDAAVSSTSGAITLTAGGAISQDATNGSLATSGLLSTSSDGGTVLNGANAVGAFTATNTGTGNIELTNTIATLDIQGITQNTGDVIVDNTGAITQSVAGITTVADGNIALTASTDLTISEVVTAGGAGTIDLTATTGALAIDAAVSSTSGAITLTAGGAISQDATNGSLATSGLLSTSSDGGTVLNGANAVGAFTATNTGTGNIELTNTIATLDIQGITQNTGDVIVDNTGAITQSVAGITTVADGNIALTASTDLTISEVVTAGGAGTIDLTATTGALAIDAAVSSTSGAITLTAGGAISQDATNGSLATSGLLSTSSDGGTVLNGANAVGAFTATNTGTGNIELTNTIATLDIQGITQNTGDVIVDNTGAITQSVAGITTVADGNIALTASTDLTISEVVTAGGAGTIDLTATTGALAIDAAVSSTSGAITLTAGGAISQDATNGSLATSGLLSTSSDGGTVLNGANAVGAFTATNTGTGNIELTNTIATLDIQGITQNTGDVIVDNTGAITQSVAGITTVADGNIALTASTDLTISEVVTAGGAGTIDLTATTGALAIDAAVSSTSGAITLTAGGAISQDATNGSLATSGLLSTSSDGGTVLNGANAVGAFTATNTGTGNIELTNTIATLDIQGITQNTGDVIVDNTGAITQSVAGITTVADGNIALTASTDLTISEVVTAGGAGTIDLTATTGALAIDAAVSSTSGAITLTAGGAISQDATNGSLATSGLLSTSSDGGTVLNGANAVGAFTATNTGTGNIELTNTIATLDIQGITQNTGDVIVDNTGAITQSVAGITTVADGNIALTASTDLTISEVVTAGGAGTIDLTATTGALAIDAAVSSTSGAITLTAGGAISQDATNGSLATSGLLSTSSDGGTVLNGANAVGAFTATNTGTGNIELTNTIATLDIQGITQNTGDVIVDNTGAITQSVAGITTVADGNIALTASTDLTISEVVTAGGAGTIDLTATTGALAIDAAVSSTSGAITLTAGGAISQDATNGSLATSGLLSTSSDGGTVLNGANAVGAFTATNTGTGNIELTNTIATLDIQGITQNTGDVIVDNTGAITQSVAGITTVADGNIALTASTDLTISEVVTAGGAGTIDLTATTGALAIDAAVSSTSGAITLTAGGAISQDATNGSLATSGLLSTSSDGGTVLNGANAVGAFTATNTGTGNIELTNTIATLDIQGITQNTGDVIVDNTGAITQSVAGITTVADGNIALTASTDLTISEVVTAGGAGTIDLTATTGALAIDAAVSSTSGAITLTAGGAISQDATNGSLATSGLLSTSSDGGTVLNGANAVGAFTATNTGTGNIELTNTIATLDIQGITQNTGDVIVDNTGAITQSVAGITTVADGNIALTASTDLTISEVVTAGGAGTIDLTATTGALAIDAAVSSTSGAITLTAGGAISQDATNGSLATSGLLSTSSDGGTVLNGANAVGAFTATNTGTGNIELTNTIATLDIQGITQNTGDVIVDNTGAITQSVAGITTVADGNIALTASTDLTISEVVTAGGAGTIDLTATTGALAIDAAVSSTSGAITLTAGGAISQDATNGSLATSGLLSTSSDGGTVLNGANAVGAFTATNTGTGNIELTNTIATLDIQGITQNTGDVIVDNTGAITQSVAGITTVADGNIALTASTDLTISEVVTAGGAGTIDLTATTGALAIDAAVSSTSGAITLTAGGAISQDATNGSLATSGLLSTSSDGGTVLNGANAVGAFTATNTGTGNIELTNTIATLDIQGITQNTGDVIVDNTGAITQSVAGITTVADGNIALTASTDLTISEVVTAGGAGTIDLTATTGALAIDAAVSSTSGAITLTAGGAISQDATNGSLATSGLLSTSSDGGTVLNGANAVGAFTATNTGTGNIELTNTIATLDIQGITQNTGDVIVDNTGAITQSVAGITTVADGNIALTASTDLTISEVVTAGGAGTIDLTATTGALAIDAAVSSTSGAITLTAGGAISQDATNGSLATSGLLSTSSDGGTVLNGANAVGAFTATNTGTGNIELTNTIATLDIQGITQNTGDVIVDNTGAITQSVAGITTVADGNIALTASTDLTISEVVTAGGAGTIDLTATTGALAIDAAVSSTSGAITLTAGGAISQDATNGSLATSGLLSTSSDGGTVLNGANAVGAFTATNTGTGNIELTNTIATLDIQGITQNTGDVIVDNTGAITQSVAGITTVADGNIALTASTDLTISEVVTAGGAGTIDLTATTGALAIDAAVSSTSGAITLTAGGAISQDATNGSLATSGLLSTSSDGGTVLNGANAVGAFTATNTGTGNIELTNTIATLDIQGITQNTGDVIVDNTGAITQSVAGITTVADGNIALTASTDLTISEVVTAGGAGTIDLTATTGALAIDAAVSSTSGAITLTAGGAISQDATNGSLATSGLLSTSSDGGTVLNGANAVGAFTATNTGTGNIELTNTIATLDIQGITQNTGDVIVDNTGAISIDGTVTIGGNLALTATGSITDAAGVTIAVTSNASFSGTSITLGDNGGDTTNFGTLTFNSIGAVSITEDSGTQLTGTNTANSLTLTSAGAITNTASASISVTGLAEFTANGGASTIALGTGGADTFNAGTLSLDGSTVQVTENSATTLDQVSATSLTLISGGAINNAASASISVTNLADLTAGGGTPTITLGTGGSDTFNVGTLSLDGSTVQVTENSATTLDQVSATALTLISGGAINNAASASISVTNLADFTAGGGTPTITLGTGGSDTFNVGTLSLDGSTVQVTENSATTLDQVSATALTLISGGAITDAAGANVAVTGTTSLTAGANSITLDSTTNDFGGAVTVVSATNVTLDDTNALTLAAINATGNAQFDAGGAVTFTGVADIGGNLTVNSIANGGAGANITDTGSGRLLVTGTTSLTAGTGSITLDNVANDYTGAVTIVSATNVTLEDDTALTLVAVNATGNAVFNAGGPVTFTGTADIDGNLTVNSIANGGAGAAITDGAAGELLVGGTSNLTAGTGSITLDNTTNNFVGVVTIQSATNASLRDANTLELGDVTATGTLTLNVPGAVTQDTGTAIDATNLALLGTGTYTLFNAGNDVTTIAADGPSGVNYRDANGITVGSVGVTDGMNVAGNIQLTTLGGGTLTVNQAITTTANGNITLNNAGNLTVNAVITADGNVIQNGAGITILQEDIFTSNDLVEFAQNVQLGGAGSVRSIDTSTNPGTGAGGTIRFLGNVNGGGSKALTMVTPGTTGDVQIDGSATGLVALTISNARDVNLQAVSTSGVVDITAQRTATLGGALTTANSLVILKVDDLALTGTINAGTGNVQIRPATATAGQQIELGAAGSAANILRISDAELDRITTDGFLTIGAINHSGKIAVSGAINPANATGGFRIINRSGGIEVGADVTYNGPGAAGNLTLTANGDGTFATGAITDSNSGSPFEIRARNLTLNAATGIGTSGSPIDITGGTVAARNTTSGGIFLRAPNGNLTVGGTGVRNDAGGIELTANALGAGAGSTIDVNAPITANGRVVVRAADDISINGQVNSNGGDIYIIAGNAPGMNIPGVTPASEPSDTIGGVTITNRVRAGAGDIVINATESVIQSPLPAPNTGGGGAGLQNTGDLIVRTYNNTPGGAVIDLRHDDNGVGNTNGQVTLETRFRNDASAPNEPGGGYAASNIDYRSYTGVVLSGIGTSADFVAIAATQDIDLNALNIQAKNLTLIANAGDVNVNTQITNSQINNGNTGGSLNLLASGNVNVNHVAGKQGITIGRLKTGLNPNNPDHFDPETGLPKPDSIEKFNHDLKLVAQNDINIEGGIHLKGDLRLRADASLAEATTVGGAASLGNGTGSVNIRVPGAATDPVVISAENIIVGTLDSAGRPLPVQNLTVTAGTALPGGAGKQSASASLQAALELKVLLTGDLTLTGGNVSAGNQSADTSTVVNAATATIGGYTVEIRGVKLSDNPAAAGLSATNSSNIVLNGGTATAIEIGGNQGIAKANASALILSGSTALIDIGGDFVALGGRATSNGVNMIAEAIAGTEIGTRITGNELLNISSRNMYISGGTGISVNGGVADGFAGIASSGAIRLSFSGDDGLVLAGAAGSGRFDALGQGLVRLTGAGYPITVSGGIVILVGADILYDSLSGVATIVLRDPNNPVPVDRRDGLVIAGAPLVDESLLAAFLRATEAAREETLAQDPSLQTRGSKGQAGVCK